MLRYIHQHPEWPHFEWREDELVRRLADVRFLQGRLIGRMDSLGLQPVNDALLETLTGDVVKSSEIEGENTGCRASPLFGRPPVRYRIRGLLLPDRSVDGVVEMTLDATQKYAEPLTFTRLFAWHAALFPSGSSGMMPITVGKWRDDRGGPMQVVSGPIGREKVHYEASSGGAC